MRFALLSVVVVVAISGCKQSETQDGKDMAVAVEDMAMDHEHDLASEVPPDLAGVVLDLTAPPPDLMSPPDLFGVVQDLTFVPPDMTVLPDLRMPDLFIPSTWTVTQSGFAFQNNNATIKTGGTVTWVFMSSGHSVNFSTQAPRFCSGSGSPDTGELTGAACILGGEGTVVTAPSGATYTHTFSTAGTFDYRCGIHTSMKGTITVVD